MEILQCVSWVSFLWKQAHEEYVEDDDSSGMYLPYDIIVEIFTRLPAESVVQCSRYKLFRSFTTTSRFVDMHLHRAEQVICLQHYTYRTYPASKRKLDTVVSFTNDKATEITVNSFKMDSGFAFLEHRITPFLYGSYRGFLLFGSLSKSVLYLLNPVTKTQATVVAPSQNYGLRGFYFHPASGEYKVLYEYKNGPCFKFMLFSLKTKSLRKIIQSSHAPCQRIIPTIFNGALHWMVNDVACEENCGESTHCSNAIVVFNMDGEEFSTMSHPGSQCNLTVSHHMRMNLMECDGCLCLCDSSSGNEIVMWILEDYNKQFWVKRQVVIIERLKTYCSAPNGCDCDANHNVQTIHVYGNELLIRVFHSDVFLCSLSSGGFRRVGKQSMTKGDLLLPFVHTNSVASFHIDGVVSLSP